MMTPPDQFHRRVRVRLPFADRLLEGHPKAAEALRELEASFQAPLLHVIITPPDQQAVAAGERRPPVQWVPARPPSASGCDHPRGTAGQDDR